MSIFNKYPYTDFHEMNLDWIIAHFKEFIDEISSLESWRTSHEAEYEELKNLYTNIVSGNFPEPMKQALYLWCKINVPEIISSAVKNVFFGLNDDGYFVAFIPDSWDDIIFNTTGLDITVELEPRYGHLVLSY